MTRSPPPPTIPAVGSPADRTPTIDSDTGPIPLGLGPHAEPDLIDTRILLEFLDSAVRGIFSVALTLSAARNLTEGPATTRLDQALDEIDDLVRELRHTALNAHLPTPARARAGLAPPPGSTPADPAPDLVDQAASALTSVDAVLIGLWNDAVTDTSADPNARECITTAARLVRAAKKTLTNPALI
jgi:hypothetical protein